MKNSEDSKILHITKEQGRKSLKEELQILEITMIREAMQVHRYNQKKAAVALSFTYDQLRGKLRKYGSAVE